MNLKLARLLGAYLVMACVLQICAYLALSVSVEKFGWLYYLDPRIGIFFVESAVRGAEQPPPGVFGWVSAAWILALGLFLLSGRLRIKTYIISEIVLSLPNLLFVVAIALANLSSAHGFSVGELFFPVLVMIAFSVIPLILAFRARSKGVIVE